MVLHDSGWRMFTCISMQNVTQIYYAVQDEHFHYLLTEGRTYLKDGQTHIEIIVLTQGSCSLVEADVAPDLLNKHTL